MNTANPLSEAELIEAHKIAKANLKRAKRRSIMLPLGILVVVVAFVGWRVYNFFHNEVKVVVKNVMAQSPEVVAPVLADASKAVSRVVPVYEQAFKDAYNRDLPIYKKLMAGQIEAFGVYAQESQVRVMKKFKAMQGKLLKNIEGHLAANMTDEEKKEFEIAVAKALYIRAQEELRANWQGHIDHVKTICADFEAIADTTPALKSQKPGYLMGVGLELMGIKLQEAAK